MRSPLVSVAIALLVLVPNVLLLTPNIQDPDAQDLTKIVARGRPTDVLAPELRYRLLEQFGDLLFCDPDFYPISLGDERERALQAFPDIQKDIETFRAITKHVGLERIAEFSDDQKLLVYREYKKLRAIPLESLGEKYKFTILVAGNQPGFERKSGFRIDGLIDRQGHITVVRKEPGVLNCPICLAGSTRIDAPAGPVAVKDLKKGMRVWTLDARNKRVALPILRTTAVPVPAGHSMIHLVVKDGRELWASMGHPTSDGRTIDHLQQNAVYDGAKVDYTEVVPYEDAKTYDLLPAGDTGFYWANGILLASTLR